MSDETKLDDGWDALLGLPVQEPARGASAAQPPRLAAPSVAAPKISAPALARPPRVGTLEPPTLEPPTLGTSTPTPPPTVGTPVEGPRPTSATLGDLRLPGPKPAPPRASAFRLPPPTTNPPRPTTSVGLPPPPEFLPRGSSAELPLENQIRDETGPRQTLVQAAHLASPTDVSDRLELDSLEIEVQAEAEHDPAPEPSPDDSLEIEAPAELQPGDSMEVDLEVSDDVLPRLADAGGQPIVPAKPLPSQLPRTPDRPAAAPPASAIPTMRAPPVSPAEPRPRSARFAEVLPADTPTRSLAPWIGVGVAAVISIAVVAWLGMGSDDPPPALEATPTATAAPEPTAPSPEPTPPEPTPSPATAADPPAPDEPTPPELAPLPVVPKPDPDAAIIEVKPDTSAYDRAAADHAATGSHEALLAMTIAGCALRDGPRARAAFRKLLGRALRTEAIVACRKAGVDVMANVEGHTGPELLVQARAALEAGDAQAAFDKAYASNKVERSSAAVLLQGVAACALGEGDKAQRLLPHIRKKARPELVERCKARGIALRL